MAHGELTDNDRARIALAAQMRRGMHLLVGREHETSDMNQLAKVLAARFDELEPAARRVRGSERWESPDALSVPGDGEQFANSVDRPVSGHGNPFSVPLDVFRDGDSVRTTVVLDDGFEGAPGRSHGGLVAAIFDDLFGFISMLNNGVAFTASLTVNYIAPSPVREPVTFTGRVDRVEGRKIFLVGECLHDDVVVTTCHALFIDATEYFKDLYS